MKHEPMQASDNSASETIRTIPPHDTYLLGQTVDEAVVAAGGTTSALFTVTEALTKMVAYGARRLRKLYRLYLRTKLIDEASVAIFPNLVGDPDASMVDIGKRVDAVVSNMHGANPIDAVKPLVARLNSVGAETSSAFLLRCRTAFLVAKLGGPELARLIPAQYPATALPALFRLTKGQLPWMGQARVLKAAKRLVKRQPQGKRQVEAIVANVLAEEARKTPTGSAVFVSWYIPPKPVRVPKGKPTSNAYKAA